MRDYRTEQSYTPINGAQVCTSDDLNRLAREIRENERQAVEKAMDAIIEVYGPALKELEKH